MTKFAFFVELKANRGNSVDSRMPKQMGDVPFGNIIGRVERVIPGPASRK